MTDTDTWSRLLDAAGCDPNERPEFKVEALLDYVEGAAKAYRDSRAVHEKLYEAHKEIGRLQCEVAMLRGLAHGATRPTTKEGEP